MNFLSSLLPGIRELRAPLAAGYLWLAAAGLAVSGPEAASVPTSLHSTLEHVYAAVGPTGLAAGATFAAYLVGVVSTTLSSALGRKKRPPSGPIDVVGFEMAERVLENHPHLSHEQVCELAEAVVDRAPSEHGRRAVRELKNDPEMSNARLPYPLGRALASAIDVGFDRSLLQFKLGAQNEAWSLLDRDCSEAEFRWGTAAPLLAVAAALSWRLHADPMAYVLIGSPSLALALLGLIRYRNPDKSSRWRQPFRNVRLGTVYGIAAAAVMMAGVTLALTSSRGLVVAAVATFGALAGPALWLVGGAAYQRAKGVFVDVVHVSRIELPAAASLNRALRDLEAALATPDSTATSAGQPHAAASPSRTDDTLP